MPHSTLTIREIKRSILHGARERQVRIERGEVDVPLHYRPLPLCDLLDLLSQWEYRRDSLALAVPPPSPGIGAWLGRFCKSLVCKSLRWLLIRQVECNTAAIRHGQAVADVLAAADKNQAELLASLINLKLQVHNLASRIAELERREGGPKPEASQSPEFLQDADDCLQIHPVYLDLLLGSKGTVTSATHLVGGTGKGDLLRFLISEGIRAQGVEPEVQWFDYCRERELPVFHSGILDFLASVEDGSLGGIVLQRESCKLPARQLAPLLQQCWRKLHKGALLIAEMENPLPPRPETGAAPRLPVELMCFLFESHCFTLADSIFSAPVHPELSAVVRTSTGRPFDQKQYRHFAVAGRK